MSADFFSTASRSSDSYSLIGYSDIPPLDPPDQKSMISREVVRSRSDSELSLSGRSSRTFDSIIDSSRRSSIFGLEGQSRRSSLAYELAEGEALGLFSEARRVETVKSEPDLLPSTFLETPRQPRGFRRMSLTTSNSSITTPLLSRLASVASIVSSSFDKKQTERLPQVIGTDGWDAAWEKFEVLRESKTKPEESKIAPRIIKLSFLDLAQVKMGLGGKLKDDYSKIKKAAALVEANDFGAAIQLLMEVESARWKIEEFCSDSYKSESYDFFKDLCTFDKMVSEFIRSKHSDDLGKIVKFYNEMMVTYIGDLQKGLRAKKEFNTSSENFSRLSQLFDLQATPVKERMLLPTKLLSRLDTIKAEAKAFVIAGFFSSQKWRELLAAYKVKSQKPGKSKVQRLARK